MYYFKLLANQSTSHLDSTYASDFLTDRKRF